MMRRELVRLRPHAESLHLYHGRSLVISQPDGAIESGIDGFYYQYARMLSRWRLLVDGRSLQSAGVSQVTASSMLGYFVDPGIKQQVGGLEPEESGVAVRISRSLRRGLHEDVDVENHSQAPLHCALEWEIDGDFADFEEALAGERRQTAPVSKRWCDEDTAELRLHYDHPQFDRGVAVRFTRARSQVCRTERGARCDVSLAPGESAHFCVLVEPIVDGVRVAAPGRCYAFAVEHDGSAGNRHAGVSTSNMAVKQAYDTAVGDLEDLALQDEGWPNVIVPAAGIPSYQSLFGRDTITSAWQAAMAKPLLMEATLHRLAGTMGTEYNDELDEQPGRIVHQLNLGPLATLGITPHRRYYGDYAAPPAFLILLGQHYAWTGDGNLLRRYYGAAERSLEWLRAHADGDGDGFIEYQTRSEKGQKNQGWKDSAMALVDEEGRGVANPITTCELQGYVYAGKQQYASAIALGLKKFGEAGHLLREASELKRRFNSAFWMPEERFYAFALGPDKRQVRSITSNPGHCLATGIVDSQHAEATAARIMAPDMFSGWGVRTLSSSHPSFNPLSYQLGSVWPVENATIAFGLSRYGFRDRANDVCGGMFDAATLFPYCRLPEAFGGYPRDDEHPHPGLYPRAQSPQACSASAVALFLQSILALRPIAPLGLLLIDPKLPPWLPDLTLHDLQVGKAFLTIRFHRERDGSTGWRVLASRGQRVSLIRQPPESQPGVSLPARARDAVTSLIPALH